MTPHKNSQHYRVLTFIREHPDGVRRKDLIEAFPSFKIRSINSILATLRNHDLVFNNGVVGSKGSVWYPRTSAEVAEPFPSIAADLVREMNSIHYAARELHLARRLEEIFGQ